MTSVRQYGFRPQGISPVKFQAHSNIRAFETAYVLSLLVDTAFFAGEIGNAWEIVRFLTHSSKEEWEACIDNSINLHKIDIACEKILAQNLRLAEVVPIISAEIAELKGRNQKLTRESLEPLLMRVVAAVGPTVTLRNDLTTRTGSLH
jgi:hypothetical protein